MTAPTSAEAVGGGGGETIPRHGQTVTYEMVVLQAEGNCKHTSLIF